MSFWCVNPLLKTLIGTLQHPQGARAWDATQVSTRRVGLTLFLVVVTALATYGVVTTPDPRPVAEIGRAGQFVCALPQDTGRFLAEPPPQQFGHQRPARGTVPDGFTPAAAIVCDIDVGSHVDADGTTVYYERRYTGDFGKALRALDAPPTRRSLFDVECLADMSAPAPVDMWLIDDAGRAVEPSYPRGYCGLDNTLGLIEIQSLPEVGAVEHRLRLDAAGILYHFSCPPVLPEPTPGTRSLLDQHVSPSGFCSFDTSGPEPEFLGGDRYDNTANLDWNAALAGAAPAGSCAERATTTAATVLTGIDNEYAVIELDGCKRVLADGYIPLSAPAVLLDAIRVVPS